MTTYEHAMLGATLALAVGCHRRREDWLLVAVAGAAAAAPDWDGLSLAFGAEAYARAHRTWGHNLLAASVAGLAVGAAGYLCHLSARVQRAVARMRSKSSPADIVVPAFSCRGLARWAVVGWLAALSHLPADLVYSGHPQLRSWPIQVFWPFSTEGWVWPLVSWGDLTTTFLFIAEMFVLYRWPKHAQLIAVLTLVLVHAYVGWCWLAQNH
jgi:membrane-bound metal-dependent hydrolase YbcI (DUF457 family)